MIKKKVVVDILCFESFFKAPISYQYKSEFYFLHEAKIFTILKYFYSTYLGVKFIKIGQSSYSEELFQGRSLYEHIHESVKEDVLFFLKLKNIDTLLSKFIKNNPVNKRKLDYSLISYLFPFFYRTREVLSLTEFERIKPDIILLKRSHLGNAKLCDSDYLVKYYNLYISAIFSINIRDKAYFDKYLYRKYNSSRLKFVLKDITKKCLIFFEYCVFKPSLKSSNGGKSIGVELLQVKIDLSKVNDLFFIDNTIINDEDICLIENQHPLTLSGISKNIIKIMTSSNIDIARNQELKEKYSSESYDQLSDKNYSRLKILNGINLISQIAIGEVNQNYKKKNLAFLIGRTNLLSYILNNIKLLFHIRNDEKYLLFLLKKFKMESDLWTKIYKEANLKILWSMFDGGEDQLIKSQAIENCDGFFSGSHWSLYPLMCIDNQKCYDILFTWSDHFSRMLNQYYLSKKTYIIGYPSTDYLHYYVKKAKEIRQKNSNKFIITFNDNSFFSDTGISEKHYIAFYDLAIETINKHQNVIVYVKPKRSEFFNKYFEKNQTIKKYINQGRIKPLLSETSRSKVPPGFPAMFSNLVVGLGLSTTTIESTICGALSYNIDFLGYSNNEFSKKSLNKIVFNDKESLLEAIDRAIEGNIEELYIESLEYYKILDPFMDKKSKTRISEGLKELIGINYKDL
jgi:hypothetical protein